MNESDRNKPFYPIHLFPEFSELIKNYHTVLEELEQNKTWLNWGSDAYDPMGHCKFLTGDWTICPLYFGKVRGYEMNVPGMSGTQLLDLTASLPKRFPKSTELLKPIKNINFAAFSRLHPKSKLAPHKHDNPDNLILHMGLVIPPGETCGLKVGDITHFWHKPGEAVVFNDTFEHSAWNDSDQERIILYIDFVRHR